MGRQDSVATPRCSRPRVAALSRRAGSAQGQQRDGVRLGGADDRGGGGQAEKATGFGTPRCLFLTTVPRRQQAAPSPTADTRSTGREACVAKVVPGRANCLSGSGALSYGGRISLPRLPTGRPRRGDFAATNARNSCASPVSGWLPITTPRDIAAHTRDVADFATGHTESLTRRTEWRWEESSAISSPRTIPCLTGKEQGISPDSRILEAGAAEIPVQIPSVGKEFPRDSNRELF